MRSKRSVFDLIPVDRGEGVDMGHVMQRRTLSMRSGTGRRRVERRKERRRKNNDKLRFLVNRWMKREDGKLDFILYQ